MSNVMFLLALISLIESFVFHMNGCDYNNTVTAIFLSAAAVCHEIEAKK